MNPNVLRQFLEAARQTLRRSLRGRILRVFLVLVVLAAVALSQLSQEITDGQTGNDFLGIALYFGLLQFALPLAGAHLGATAVRGDVERGTLGLLLARPISRTTLLLGRWAGASLLVIVFGLIVVGLWTLGVNLNGATWRRGLGPTTDGLWAYAAVIALAGPAYAAVGTFLGARFAKPVVWTIVYVGALEVIASHLPAGTGIRDYTVAASTNELLLLHLDTDPNGSLTDVLLGPPLPGERPVTTTFDAVRRVLQILLVGLGLGVYTFRRREYADRERD